MTAGNKIPSGTDAMRASLPWRHALLAFSVIVVWGSNFVVIKSSLGQFPPLLFAALRFTFALLPAVFFLKRPDVPWRQLAAYGLLIGVGQFGALYMAMNGQISPSLASVVMQSQVLFTILLSVWLEGERLRAVQVMAIALAGSGIGVIAWHTDGDTTALGLGMALFAALSWAGGNFVAKLSGKINMLSYVVWASMFCLPPLFALSFLIEGWDGIENALRHADTAGWAGVLWQTVGNTLFGYVAWGWLLARHPSATIAPLALLIPIVGLASAVWRLDEPMPAWKLAAATLVVGGVALNILWPRMKALTGRSHRG